MKNFIPKIELRPVEFDPFTGPVIVCSYPTTQPQREVWAASQLDATSSCAYNESVSLHLSGPLDIGSLESACRDLVERHEGMRTVFSATGLRGIVLEHMAIPLETYDLRSMGEAEQAERIADTGRQLMTTAFDLEQGPLYRTILFRISDTENILRIVGHHVVADGWSLGILMGDLSQLYNAHVTGTPPTLEEAIPYSRYAMDMDEILRSAENDEVLRYWEGLYADHVPRLDLPTDQPRTETRSWNAMRTDIPMDPGTMRRLRALATRAGSSFVTTMLATFELLIARVSGQRDIVTGLPAAGQSDMGMKNLVGHCVSLLPLRARIDEDSSFLEYLKRRRTEVLDAFDHQRFTFSTLLQQLRIPREPGRIPLVPVIFNIDMDMDDGVSFHGIEHRFHSDPRAFEQFEMTLNAAGSGDRMTMEWSYNSDLFSERTVRGWMDQLTALIERVADDPDTLIGDLLDDRPATGDVAVPAAWSGRLEPLPEGITVAHLFDAAAQRHPRNRALVQGSIVVDHATLRDRVDALAMRLSQLGAGPGTFVGLCADQGPDLITGELAIIRAGAAFVPIDPELPDERITHIITDADLQLVVSDARSAEQLRRPGLKLLLLDEMERAPILRERPPFRATADDPVYMIYTSGSTGMPKGVVVPHRGIVRLVTDQSYIPLGPDRVFHHHMSISFDAAQLGIMSAMLHGGTLVISSHNEPSLSEIAGSIATHGVNTITTPAGLFKLLVDSYLPQLKGLDHLIVGGDVLPPAYARKALDVLGPGVLINGYGPTEDSVMCTTFAVTTAADTSGPVPIGKPLVNATAYVLDEQQRPVAMGRKGELYLGGPGVAIGYWNRPDLTEKHFMPDPFSAEPGARMYRTGDQARWRDDGNLEFLGRVDNQVKVRGHRVELAEINAALDDLAPVKDRIAVARRTTDGEKSIHLYVVPHDPQLADDGHDASATWTEEVRAHLAEQLPDYMLPATVTPIPSMPLTHAGKPDKAKLPAPWPTATVRSAYITPRTPTEKLLADLWTRKLKTDRVGINDNFFEIGGHSLLGIQVLAKLEKRTGKQIPVKALFQAPTIAQLAKLVDSTHAEANGCRYLMPIQPHGHLTPFFCVHGDEANVYLPKYLGNDRPFHAFFHQGEDGKPIRYTTVEELASQLLQELRTVRPYGPYLLGGYSFGGIVAYEMAYQLTLAGEEVAALVLFDTYAPADGLASIKSEQNLLRPIKNAIMRRLVRAFHGRGKILPGKLRHFHIIDTYDRATRAYRPSRYPGNLTLLRAASSPGSRDMGWGELVDGHVIVKEIEGDHFSIIKKPHVRALGEQLKELLDRNTTLLSAVG